MPIVAGPAGKPSVVTVVGCHGVMGSTSIVTVQGFVGNVIDADATPITGPYEDAPRSAPTMAQPPGSVVQRKPFLRSLSTAVLASCTTTSAVVAVAPIRARSAHDWLMFTFAPAAGTSATGQIQTPRVLAPPGKPASSTWTVAPSVTAEVDNVIAGSAAAGLPTIPTNPAASTATVRPARTVRRAPIRSPSPSVGID